MNPSFSGNQHPEANLKDAFQEHNAKRRVGGFEQAGEHARTGNRGRQ
jgi:hypothetical protein